MSVILGYILQFIVHYDLSSLVPRFHPSFWFVHYVTEKLGKMYELKSWGRAWEQDQTLISAVHCSLHFGSDHVHDLCLWLSLWVWCVCV